MYSVADRLQLLSPGSFAATQTLGSLGQDIMPSLLSREAGAVRASLHFLLHALVPLTAMDDIRKVGPALSASQGFAWVITSCGAAHGRLRSCAFLVCKSNRLT